MKEVFFDVKMVARTQDISLEDLFRGGNTSLGRKRVLISGKAGVGKTTLMKEACRKWKDGKLWNGLFDNIVFVSMKNENQLEEIEVLRKENEHKRTLWIFDEWSKVQELQQKALVALAKNKDPLIYCAVFVCRSLDNDLESIYQSVQLEGLSASGQREFIRRFFGYWDEKERLEAAVTLALCMKRKGFAFKSLSRLFYRAVMDSKIEEPPEAERAIICIRKNMLSSFR